jgi:hypothetical protein
VEPIIETTPNITPNTSSNPYQTFIEEEPPLTETSPIINDQPEGYNPPEEPIYIPDTPEPTEEPEEIPPHPDNPYGGF